MGRAGGKPGEEGGGRGEGGRLARGSLDVVHSTSHGQGCARKSGRPGQLPTGGLCAVIGRVGIRGGRRATRANVPLKAGAAGCARKGWGGVSGGRGHVVHSNTGTAAQEVGSEGLQALRRALRVCRPSRHQRWATRDGRDCAYRGREKSFCTLGLGSCAGRGRHGRGFGRVSAFGKVSVCKCFGLVRMCPRRVSV